MAIRAAQTVTTQLSSSKMIKETPQVGAIVKPIAKQLICSRSTIHKEEEWIVEYRRAQLAISLATPNINRVCIQSTVTFNNVDATSPVGAEDRLHTR